MTRAAVLLLLGLLAAAPSAGEPAADALADERRQLLELDRAFGRAPGTNDAARLRSLLADDAVFLGQTVRRGSGEFVAEWSSLMNPRTDAELEWQPLEAGVARSADLAYTIGEVRVEWTRGRAREELERSGHYLSIWQKNSQGAWKIRASGTLASSPEGPYGYGRERLRGLAEVWPPLKELGAAVELSWQPEAVVEASSGDLAFTFGVYTVATRVGEDEASGSGGYLTLWRRDAQGFWVVVAEAFSPPL